MTASKPQEPPLPYEDEVLRRMLSTPPKPHKAKESTPTQPKRAAPKKKP